MNCPTCNLPTSDHTEEMAANCAVFQISADARTSEAETSDGLVRQPPQRDPGPSEPSGISVASVLLGWCNDIKRELEEFANDGPVGPMVPYRAEANASLEDLQRLQESLTGLAKVLVALRSDVIDARYAAMGGR